MHLNFLGNFTIKPIIKLETLYSFIYHYYFLYKVYFYYISTLIRHIYFKTTKLRSPRPQIEICIHFYLLKHNVLYVFCQHLWALYERTPATPFPTVLQAGLSLHLNTFMFKITLAECFLWPCLLNQVYIEMMSIFKLPLLQSGVKDGVFFLLNKI